MQEQQRERSDGITKRKGVKVSRRRCRCSKKNSSVKSAKESMGTARTASAILSGVEITSLCSMGIRSNKQQEVSDERNHADRR